MSIFQKMFQTVVCFSALMCCLFLGACQKKPALAPSADPLSAIEPPPMGATTYNDELKRELAILNDLLEKKIPEATLTKIKQALMNGNAKALSEDKTSNESHLAKVLLTLPELVHLNDHLSNNRKLWLTGKFLFLKRRFIEAAMKMTEVLKQEPNFIEARNWRARAIFFLGNPDLAILELQSIIQSVHEKSAEALDATYLIGAIIYESNDNDKRRVTTGIKAWERYLEVADPNPNMKQEIMQSLAELKLRQDGKIKPDVVDPFLPNEEFGVEKNAILVAFAKNELQLTLTLAENFLKKSYDSAVATLKARVLFKQGHVDDAALLFLAIITKDRSYAPGYHYQGMAFMLKGEPENAITAWSKTVQLDPTYANSHGLLQRIAVAQKMVGEKKGG